MLVIRLSRDKVQDVPYCTLGVLDVPGLARVQTVERPWVPVEGALCGHQHTSCIGVGLYRLDARETESKGKHWILSNAGLGVYRYEENIPAGVYARCLVLIHAANWAHELLGCIAPGLSRGYVNNEWGVRSSQAAMVELRDRLADTPVLSLEIV